MAIALGPDEISDFWQSVLAALKGKFTEPVFEMWLKPMRLIELSDREATLSVNTKFARDWAENRLRSDLTTILSDLLQHEVAPRFVVTEAEGHRPVAASEPLRVSTPRRLLAPQPASDDLHSADLNKNYTFEHFVVGSFNRLAHAAAVAAAQAPAKAYNPLFLWGGVGLGKTHLMHAIGNHVISENPRANVVYVSTEKFTNEFIIAIKNNETLQFRNKYRHADVLLIDDIQFLEGKEQTQEEFFHTFNSLYESSRQLVISSDRAPTELQTLEHRLRSRFGGGLTIDVQTPDVETREAILRKKAESESVHVPDEVTSLIAKLVPSNIRELEGALIRVVAFASLTKCPVTSELAIEALKNVIPVAPVRRVTIAHIKDVVAKAHALTVKEMDNHRRDQRLAAPRQIAMYVSTVLTDNSLPQIAREFNKKDHTTVMYARDKVKELMERDEAYRSKVEQLIASCQHG
jgi:chromosomal replication initiator protein